MTQIVAAVAEGCLRLQRLALAWACRSGAACFWQQWCSASGSGSGTGEAAGTGLLINLELLGKPLLQKRGPDQEGMVIVLLLVQLLLGMATYGRLCNLQRQGWQQGAQGAAATPRHQRRGLLLLRAFLLEPQLQASLRCYSNNGCSRWLTQQKHSPPTQLMQQRSEGSS